MRPRIREAGDSALLLELEPVIDPQVNARAIAIATAIRGDALGGLRDVVSTFRSVAVYFDPLVVGVATVRDTLERASSAAPRPGSGRTIEIPVAYGGADGPDLGDVAAFAGLTTGEVVEQHVAGEYRAYMVGFLPGFAYLGSVPESIAAPRRATPRVKVPAGSVGIAGRQTAVYPRDCPGGWQIIGRTPLQVFDPAASPPALIAPGDSVRFVRLKPDATFATSDRENGATHRDDMPSGFSSDHVASGFRREDSAPRFGMGDVASGLGGADVASGSSRTITVIRPGLLTTVQDSGRWNQQSAGVPVSGALDLVSHRAANALVGNERDAATLEATLAGPELRFNGAATVAISGADLAPTLDGAPLPLNTATRCKPGGVLRFGDRRAGARAYIAADGGIAVPPTLGSRSTHLLTRIGGLTGKPLAAGDHLPLGDRRDTPPARAVAIPRVLSAGGARVRVLPGPHDDWFGGDAFDTLQRGRFTIAPQSDRMGYRLQGARIVRAARGEMISDATFTGAIQVPPSGQPILLMADHQTTGGYPQIAIVISADLPLAAQLAPGDWIEFQICTHAEALAALVAQEGKLLALG